MLQLTDFIIPQTLIDQVTTSLPSIDSRVSLNRPTGEFFYDPWQIKPEYQGTVWQELLDTIPYHKGEARLIKLVPGECYPSHADVDDRWHLNIQGNHSYIIDLENNIMHSTDRKGVWYTMDAGVRHSAANFGSEDRIQLVVRQLLPKVKVPNAKTVSIKLKTVVEDRRFIFDDVISPWLNQAYKKGIVSDFAGQDLEARFTINQDYIDDLKKLIDQYFTLTVL